ncbi:hypothetical protein BJY04DRAFT_204144 [Aspergillus karnatakaensis]|uniref:uncharacterized protein n=1 Tax=Aspergillus karnatakaensis TaxID=1810916 RepID=UPI003CCD2B2C
MTQYTAIISYDSLEAYQEHGRTIEQLASDHFAAKGATEQKGFFQTRSMPPSHRAMFVAPDDVPVDELKDAGFPSGVRCDITKS